MSAIPAEIAAFCCHCISRKLMELLGERQNVEELSSFVWQTVIQPQPSKEVVAAALREYLGAHTDALIAWIVEDLTPYVCQTKPVQENWRAALAGSAETANAAAATVPAGGEAAGATSAADVAAAQPTQHVASHYAPAPRAGRASTAQKITPAHAKIRKRCVNFPNCSLGTACQYIHPEEMCKKWPKCSFGCSCFYIHPEVSCRYGTNCPNPACNYTHPAEWNPEVAKERFNANSKTFRNVTYIPEN